MIDVQQIALAILTSIITGGFVLVLVEIGNRKNRENDWHEQIVRPFMHRLSAYFRFVSWSRSHIVYPKPLNDYERFFKNLVEKIGGYGGQAITSGGDYGIGYFTASQLDDIANDINNIWYWHDKMNPCRLTWDTRMGGDFIRKELREVNPIYVGQPENVDLVAKVSGEFYTDIYQPIEYETYRHEAFMKQYRRHTIAVCGFVCFVLMLLSLMLFAKLPTLLLQIATFVVILMLIGSLLMLAVDVKSQIRWWNKVEEYLDKHKGKKPDMGKIWKKIKKTCGAVVSALLSKLVAVGLLLSAWAIFSIEIPWIPKVAVPGEAVTIAGWNKFFLALAYSYIAGVILYWFTVKLPFAMNKKRLSLVIESKISSIGSQLLNMSLEFRNLENPKVTEVETIMGLITTRRWTEACKVPYHARRSNVTEAFVYDYYEVQRSVTLLINDYKEYLSAEQLILLESLQESQMNTFFSVAEGQGQGFVFSDYFYEKVMKPSYRKLLEDYNKLAETN